MTEKHVRLPQRSGKQGLDLYNKIIIRKHKLERKFKDLKRLRTYIN